MPKISWRKLSLVARKVQIHESFSSKISCYNVVTLI